MGSESKIQKGVRPDSWEIPSSQQATVIVHLQDLQRSSPVVTPLVPKRSNPFEEESETTNPGSGVHWINPDSVIPERSQGEENSATSSSSFEQTYSGESYSDAALFPSPPAPDEDFHSKLKRLLILPLHRGLLGMGTNKRRLSLVLLGGLLLVACLTLLVSLYLVKGGSAVNDNQREQQVTTPVQQASVVVNLDLSPLPQEDQQDPNLPQRAAEALAHGLDVEALRYYRFLAIREADEPTFATIARVLQRRVRERCQANGRLAGLHCNLTLHTGNPTKRNRVEWNVE